MNSTTLSYASQQVLTTMYQQPYRKYHNINHIEDCFGTLSEYLALADENDLTEKEVVEVEMMIWWHDFIYVVGSPDNEACSGDHFLLSPEYQLLTVAQRNTIYDGILMSAKHLKTLYGLRASQALFLDIDMSGLGRDYEIFEKNGNNIRDEYATASWFSEEGFRAGRAAFFTSLLEKKHIYYNPLMRGRFEEKARDNINRWLKENHV